MKYGTLLGVCILLVLLGGIFASLYFAYGAVGKAVQRAEVQKELVPCSAAVPCMKGECVEGYCRGT